MPKIGDLHYDESDRAAAAVRAEQWTLDQATRLGLTSSEVLQVVLRGWVPSEIEVVSSRYTLEGVPPLGPLPEWSNLRKPGSLKGKVVANDLAEPIKLVQVVE